MKSIEHLKIKSALPICPCSCGNPLEEEGALGPKYLEIGDKRVRVNTDCYFDAFGGKFNEFCGEGGLGIHGPCVAIED